MAEVGGIGNVVDSFVGFVVDGFDAVHALVDLDVDASDAGDSFVDCVAGAVDLDNDAFDVAVVDDVDNCAIVNALAVDTIR